MGNKQRPTVAICVSGVPRGNYCTEFIQRISLYSDTYVFVWYWNDQDESVTKHSRRGSIAKPFDPQLFCNIPQITAHWDSDSFKKYEPEFQKLRNELPHFDCSRQDLGIYGMTFAIKKANELREKFEQKNDMVFDCVIRARFEAKFIQPGSTNYDPEAKFIVSDYNFSDQIYISHTNQDIQHGMCDCLAFSNSQNMSKYCKVFDNVGELSSIQGHNPEKIFYYNIKKYNLNKAVQYVLVGF